MLYKPTCSAYLSDVELAKMINGVIESEVPVQCRDGRKLLRGHIEASGIQVLQKPVLRVGLGDDDDSALGSPSEKDLGRGLSVLLCGGGDGLLGEEGWGVAGLLPLELKEGLGPE